MIYPKKSDLIFWFFKWYVLLAVKKNFARIIFDKISLDGNKSILLIANHFSYWDTLILFVVNERLFKKNYRTNNGCQCWFENKNENKKD